MKSFAAALFSMKIMLQQTPSRPSIQHLTYKELDILHSLRGFCAFYVVVFHAKYLIFSGKYILWYGWEAYLKTYPLATWNALEYVTVFLDILSTAGYEMVIFFFVLSGFFYSVRTIPKVSTSAFVLY